MSKTRRRTALRRRHRPSTVLMTSVAILLVTAQIASAAAPPVPDILNEAQSRLTSLWDFARKVLYFLAAMGVGIFAIGAFFGKFDWSRIIAISAAVFLLAFFEQLMKFLGAY